MKGLGPDQCSSVGRQGAQISEEQRLLSTAASILPAHSQILARAFVLSFFPLVLAIFIMTACFSIRASCGVLIITSVLQGPLTEMHKHFSNLSVLGFEADVELNTIDLLS